MTSIRQKQKINLKSIKKYENIEGTEFEGYLNLSGLTLVSLKGSPKIVTGYFNCRRNKLTSLKDCPEEIKEDFFCSNNKLENLSNGPKKINKSFVCRNNRLKSLEGIENLEINGDFDCSWNNLKNLKNLPKIKKSLFCRRNHLTSLEGSPEIINGVLDCSDNNLKSLELAPKEIKGTFNLQGNIELKNVKEQVIKYGIKAKEYQTDEGSFTFKEIEKDFVKYWKDVEKQQNKLKEKETIKQNKFKINNKDYGLSF